MSLDTPVLEIGADDAVEQEELSTLVDASPEAEQEPDVEDFADEEESPADPEGRFSSWVTTYATNPKSITQIPQSQRVAVVEAHYAQREKHLIDQANTWGQQLRAMAMEEFKQQQAAEAEWAEVAQLEEDDPASFIQWQRKNPEKATAYLRREAAPSPEKPIEAAAAEILKTATPEVMEKLKANPAKYPPTAQGLAALSSDIAKFSTETDPARKAVEKRRQAVADAKNLPRPDMGGRPAKPALNFRTQLQVDTALMKGDIDSQTARQWLSKGLPYTA